MKGNTQPVKLGLEVLTPVHAGSGETLQLDLDYMNQRGNAFVVDQNRTFDAVAAGNAALDKLLQKQTSLLDLVSTAGEHYGYILPPLQQQRDRPEKIREHIKDALFRPYLPGSSLKGAIRTALLAEWLRGIEKPAYADLLPPSPSVKPKYAAGKITKDLFGPTPNQDMLRVLRVGDANFQTGDLRLADIRWLNVINSKGTDKARWRDMRSRRSQDRWQDASGLFAEVLPKGSAASVTLQWDGFLLSEPHRWKAPERAAQLFPADFAALRDILNSHARHILQKELTFFKSYKVDAPSQECLRLLNKMESDPDAAYLRLAWGSGWRGMTGDWQDEQTINEMRRIYHLGKRSVPLFPKTRRLAVQGSPCLPLGWIKLEPWNESIAQQASSQQIQSRQHPWVDNTLAHIQQKNNCQPDEALRGVQLAQAWQALQDEDDKRTAFEEIKSRWQMKGWWENPTGKAMKKALKIYLGED